MYKFWKSKAFESLDGNKIKFDEVEDIKQPRNWQLIAKSYAFPSKYIPETLTDTGLVQKAMFGVTTILLQDSLTGEIRREEIIGSDENQLYAVLEKANTMGIQYLDYDGERFAIAKVPSEDLIPLK